MPLLIAVALIAWVVFGNPKKNLAEWFWPQDAAPWESVDGFYYPDRNDLTQDVSSTGHQSVDECRAWVNDIAAGYNDPGLIRGDYECAVGKTRTIGDIGVYRLTVR